MKKLEVINLHGNEYTCLVIANSYENPINDFLMSSKVLEIQNGKVLFDLLLINGIKSNRFISITIRNSKIDIQSICIVKEVSNDILNLSSLYFKRNVNLIENSILLPNSLKFILLNDKNEKEKMT